MKAIDAKFVALATDNAPGQESRQNAGNFPTLLRGTPITGVPVDFSHGDVDAFLPAPGSLDAFIEGVKRGGEQAYTEYRGGRQTRELLAERLERFTGAAVSAETDLIITPGSQGALFLAVASTVSAGDKVAIVQPDYFANRKLVQFFGGTIIPVRLDYLGTEGSAGLDLNEMKDAFEKGATTFLFSNPNNPTGALYSEAEIRAIYDLSERYGVTVIVDELYSRLVYDGKACTHLRSLAPAAANVITILGPSKTESLSGYRLGIAIAPPHLIERMERLQAIVSLRAPGYSQAVLRTWFNEAPGWMGERIELHRRIRDDLLARLRAVEGVSVRTTDAGSYVFPRLPELSVSTPDFVRILRHQVAVTVTPGTEFSPHALDSVRLNFSQNHDAALSAVERLAMLVERYR